MNRNDLKKLFDRIVEQTESGQLKWKPIKDDVYRVDFARSSVEIARTSLVSELFELRIYNSAGLVIDVVNNDFDQDAKQALQKLYTKAQNIALEVEATVEDILAGLTLGVDEPLKAGIYAVRFTALNSGTQGDGLVILGQGNINGGDLGYFYRGTYEISDQQISAVLNITQWNPSYNSVFGNSLPRFDLSLTGQVASGGASATLQGSVGQSPGLKIRIDCRRLADART